MMTMFGRRGECRDHDGDAQHIQQAGQATRFIALFHILCSFHHY